MIGNVEIDQIARQRRPARDFGEIGLVKETVDVKAIKDLEAAGLVEDSGNALPKRRRPLIAGLSRHQAAGPRRPAELHRQHGQPRQVLAGLAAWFQRLRLRPLGDVAFTDRRRSGVSIETGEVVERRLPAVDQLDFGPELIGGDDTHRGHIGLVTAKLEAVLAHQLIGAFMLDDEDVARPRRHEWRRDRPPTDRSGSPPPDGSCRQARP